MKHAKKAFLAILLSTLLCVTMLIGTTFAWFTDSVTSSGNIIKSGTLDIDLLAMGGDLDTTTLDAAGVTKDGEYYSFESAQDKGLADVAVFNYDLWEPGFTDWANVKVKNKGTLALKYTMAITATGTVDELAQVIDVYYAPSEVAKPATRDLSGLTRIGTLKAVLDGGNGVMINDHMLAGEEDFATIALHMQETAGNEYQDKAVGTSFTIKILATQYTYESDSFDDQYDANAQVPITVTDAAGLTAALSTAPAGAEIVLTPNVDYGVVTMDSTTNLDGVTIEADGAQLLMDIQSGATLTGVTIKNYEPTGAVNGNYNGAVTIRDGADVDIMFEDSTYATDAKLHFNNCTFDGTGSRYAFYRSGDAIDELEFTNCTFENFKKRVIMWNGSSAKAATVVIDNCTFKDSNPVDGLLKMGGALGDGSTFVFTNNTLENFVPTEGFFTTNKSDVTAPIYLTNSTFTVSVSGNTLDGAAWDPQGLILP